MSTLITGATNGIGLAYATNHKDLILGVRNTEEAKKLFNSHLIYELDMSSKISIDNFVACLIRDKITLKNVILNAGMAGTRKRCQFNGKDENMTLVVNLIAQIYLLKHLEPVLQSDTKVVFVGSVQHYLGLSDLETIPDSKAYAVSKLGIMIFAQDYSKTTRRPVIVVNPGYVNSNIWKKPRTCMEKVEAWFRERLALTPEQASIIYDHAINEDFNLTNMTYLSNAYSPFFEWCGKSIPSMYLWQDIFGSSTIYHVNKAVSSKFHNELIQKEYTEKFFV